jgi:hypothetical protein
MGATSLTPLSKRHCALRSQQRAVRVKLLGRGQSGSGRAWIFHYILPSSITADDGNKTEGGLWHAAS